LSLKSQIRERFPIGLYGALRTLRNETRIYLIHRKGVKKAKAYAGQTALKLNIGCGPNRKEGWVNIDLKPGMADMSLDMRERIPLADGSVAAIYSEHFLEHLDYPTDAKRFLGECYRVLQPGGRFSAGVPDTEWPIDAYVGRDDKGWISLCKERGWHPDWCHTPLEHVNHHFRQGGDHRFAYDFETLRHALDEAGFRDITRREPDPGIDSWEVATLYVDAIK
jgi:predicted SAM-dependent methyltransferase